MLREKTRTNWLGQSRLVIISSLQMKNYGKIFRVETDFKPVSKMKVV